MANPKHSEARRRSWVTRKERYGPAGSSRRPKRVRRETPTSPREIREMAVHNAAIEEAAKVVDTLADSYNRNSVEHERARDLAVKVRKLLRAP